MDLSQTSSMDYNTVFKKIHPHIPPSKYEITGTKGEKKVSIDIQTKYYRGQGGEVK